MFEARRLLYLGLAYLVGLHILQIVGKYVSIMRHQKTFQIADVVVTYDNLHNLHLERWAQEMTHRSSPIQMWFLCSPEAIQHLKVLAAVYANAF